MKNSITTIVISSLFLSTSSFALQGENFNTIDQANDAAGARVGWDVESDGGLVLKGDNNMESTLTVSNTRDAGGAKAPVLKVQGRNEKRALNEALPILSVESIENQAGIELTRGSMKRDAKLGWSIIYDGKDKSDLILREVRGSGNWIVTSFYKLENKMLQDVEGSEFMAQVFVPYCPTDKYGNVTVTPRTKEKLATCPE